MMRLVLSANVESARPHFDIEPITTYSTNYSHPMDTRHGSNDERNDERLEELHSCSPPHSKLDALVAVVNIDRPFFAAASEGSRADGNTPNNLRRQRGGFNRITVKSVPRQSRRPPHNTQKLAKNGQNEPTPPMERKAARTAAIL
jgi:hypothetical protein